MIRSMTGFGRGEVKTDSIQCIVEIKTVNHRYSDFIIKMPRELLPLEDRVRTELQQFIQRGKADVYITYTDISQNSFGTVSVDEGVVGAFFRAMRDASERLGYRFEPEMSMLFRIPDAFAQFREEPDQEAVWKFLEPPLRTAAERLVQMREKEGEKLAEDLKKILANAQALFQIVKERSPYVPIEYREKLTARLAELMDHAPVEEQRIAAETAIFADKCSIDEEITRFESHIQQFYDTLEAGGAVGRRLDFLVQEMNREVNTMGSKASDITITNQVIALKSEIEKLREQIQNLE